MKHRRQKLISQLTKEFERHLTKTDTNESIGSMTVWYDDYGGSFEFSRWKPDDIPYYAGASGNLDVEDYDVFDQSDRDELDSDIEEFYNRLQSLEEFKKLRLRHGFKFVIACFDDSQYLVKSPSGNTPDDFNYTLEEAIEVVLPEILKSFSAVITEPLKELRLSGSENRCNITNIVSSGEDDEEYISEYCSEFYFGLALTRISVDKEFGLESLAKKIASSAEFSDIPKLEYVFFRLFVAGYEYYCAGYDSTTQTVKNLNEEEELELRYK
jgi:hypothetical protein